MEREKIVQPEKSESLLDKIIRENFESRSAFEEIVKRELNNMKESGGNLSECELARYIIGKDNSRGLSKRDFAVLKDEIIRIIKKVIEKEKNGEQGQEQEKNNVNKIPTFHIPRNGEKIATEEMKKEARIAEEDSELIGEGFDPEKVRKEL